MSQRHTHYIAALALVAATLGLSTMASRWAPGTSEASTLPNASPTRWVRADAATPRRATQHKPFVFSSPRAQPDDIRRVQLQRRDGTRLSLEAFRGKHILLNIWATWCGPCREEMPALDRLQDRLGGEGFEVVALSIDEALDDVRDFYAKLDLHSLQIYLDDTKTSPALLKILGLPTTLLIDPDGRELARFTGPAVWDGEPAISAITEHMATSAPKRRSH